MATMAIYKPKREISEEINPADTLALAFQSPGLSENLFLLLGQFMGMMSSSLLSSGKISDSETVRGALLPSDGNSGSPCESWGVLYQPKGILFLIQLWEEVRYLLSVW